MADTELMKRAVTIARAVIKAKPADDPGYIREYSPSIRRATWLKKERRRVRGRCHFCKGDTTSPGSNGPFAATVDHVVPLARRGPDNPSNWRLACFTCNQLKGDASERDFIAELRGAGVRNDG